MACCFVFFFRALDLDVSSSSSDDDEDDELESSFLPFRFLLVLGQATASEVGVLGLNKEDEVFFQIPQN